MPRIAFAENIAFYWYFGDLYPTLQEAGFDHHVPLDNLGTPKVMYFVYTSPCLGHGLIALLNPDPNPLNIRVIIFILLMRKS